MLTCRPVRPSLMLRRPMKRSLATAALFLLLAILASVAIAYWQRATLPPAAASFLMRHLDTPHYYPATLDLSRPARLKSLADLEQWLTSAVFCAPGAILDVQDPAFIRSLQRLGVTGAQLVEGTPEGSWQLPAGTRVLGFPAKTFDFWGDSGSDFSVVVDGPLADYITAVGAKTSFVLRNEDAPVLFSREFAYNAESYYAIPAYTYFRSDKASRIGCTTLDM